MVFKATGLNETVGNRRGKGSEPEPYTVQSVDVGGTSQSDWEGTARGLGGNGAGVCVCVFLG